MANPLDIIKKNFNQSQLGQGIASMPSDERTPQERARDAISLNPNTPTPPSQLAPVEISATPEQQVPMQMPVQKGPEFQNSTTPQGNWATKAGIQPQASNPFEDAAKSAKQISGYLPSTGLNQQMDAAKGIGEAQARGFQEQEKAFGEQEKNLADSQARLSGIQQEKESALKDHDEKYNAAIADLKGMSIDSDRLWKNKSTGSKILTGIGLALSAFGGPEAVARTNQIIQGAIDRDIEEQKANYAVKKDGVQEMRSVYARMYDKFNDKEKAELATRNYYNDQVQSKLAQIGARTNNSTAKDNAKLLAGQLQGQKDEMTTKLTLALGTANASKPKQYSEVIPDNYTPKDSDEAKNYVPGLGLAADPEAAKTLRGNFATFKNFNSGVNKLIGMREKYGSETMPTSAKGEMMQVYNELILDKKGMSNLGVMSESDLEMLKSIVADPTSFNPSTLARLKALKNDGIGKFQRGVEPYLMNPVQSLGMKFKSGQF